ncbi:MAG TPA: hypothetical protein PLN93_11005, partial [Vicinamibacterales bacterium]|nr:hypothetical protein [Vicinamibacterales bacterium]
MKHQAALCAALAAAAAAVHAAAPLRWDAAIERPAAVEWPVYRGETASLQPRLLSYGAALAVTNAALTLYWQTNGMGAAWWSVPASASTSEAGRVIAPWAHTNDVGAAAYSFFIRAEIAGGDIYRAFGTLAMRDSPGWSPTSAPPAAYAWVSPDELQAVSNALASATQEAVEAEALLRIAGDSAGSNRVAEVRAEMLETNAAVAGALATALQPSWAATGTVANAQRQVAADGSRTWTQVLAGTNWLYTVSADTTSVYIASAGSGWAGPPVGTALVYSQYLDPASYYTGTWGGDATLLAAVGGGPVFLTATLLDPPGEMQWTGAGDLPATLGGDGSGNDCVLDYLPVTNRVQIATQTGTAILISEHNEST